MEVSEQHPYSPAREAAGLVFVSGSLPVSADGTVLSDPGEAFDVAFAVMEQRLGTAGLDRSAIRKMTYYVTDIALRDNANEQFLACFDEPRPARTVVEVSRLPYGAIVEIDAVAQR